MKRANDYGHLGHRQATGGANAKQADRDSSQKQLMERATGAFIQTDDSKGIPASTSLAVGKKNVSFQYFNFM